MSKEFHIPKTELESLAARFGKNFIQRLDLYPRQVENGSYICIHKPLMSYHLRAHLQGKLTLGAYVLDQDSNARYVVFDADDDDQFKRLAVMASRLAERKVPSYLESSARGGHLWLFFSKPIPGKDALLHISELSTEFVKDVKDVVSEGDVVRVKVIRVDDAGKVRVSKKALES